ncbi:ABC transporter ATP-binding protein [Bacillus swezeyi]|uniref:ATP-binding cassette domain-containing protein n=1 Tax=Bacillus swezeyi TaxID=1925020 RepID=UPI0039C5EFAA
MLSVDNLSYKINNKDILKNVNFTIAEQAITAIVGPNGAGKTTLIEILARIRGEKVNIDFPKNKRMIYIHPDMLVLDFLKTKEYIDMVKSLNGISDQEFAKVLDDFTPLKINDFQETELRHLSLGQKQKVLLLSGFLSNPDLLLFDEPFNALDINAYNAAVDLFQQYKHKFGIFFSTHELQGLSEISDSIIFIENGTIKKQLQKHSGDLKNDSEFLQLF